MRRWKCYLQGRVLAVCESCCLMVVLPLSNGQQVLAQTRQAQAADTPSAS